MGHSTRSASIRTSAVYFLLFGSLGVHLPFWPLWLEDWGLTAGEIGTYTTLGMVVRVAAGLMIPAMADRYDARRVVMALVGAVGAVLFLSHLWISGKAVLLLATLATGMVYAGLIPLSDALGTAAARVHGFQYARARSFGSIGFGCANLVVGWLIARYGVDVAAYWIVVCLGLTAWLGLHHPGGGNVRVQNPPRFADIRKLAVHPLFMIFALAASSLSASHAIYYAYGSLHWQNMGFEEDTIGLLWGAGIVAEVAFMVLVGSWLVDKLGPVGTLALSGVAGGVRWVWMTQDPTGVTLWLLQASHALSFAAMHLGMIAFISFAVPERFSATAQGLCGAVMTGLMTALATQIGAIVFPWGGGAAYAIAASLSGVGLVMTLVLAREWREGQEIRL